MHLCCFLGQIFIQVSIYSINQNTVGCYQYNFININRSRTAKGKEAIMTIMISLLNIS